MLTTLLTVFVAVHAAQAISQTPSPEALTIQPKVAATLTRDGQAVRVSWDTESRSVDIQFGSKPGKIGGSTYHVIGAKSFSLPKASERVYARLRFLGGPMDRKSVVVGERIVQLEGAGNFRDLGGYETTDGHVTKWGLIYRSDALNKLTSGDQAQLQELGIKEVFDLRGDVEVKAAPDALPATGITYTRLPISPSLGSFTPAKAGQSFGDALLSSMYLKMTDDFAAKVYGPWLKSLADEDSASPMVIHCTAGKDRTGVGSALLLALLGVPKETIVADYSLTNLDYARLSASLSSGAHSAAIPAGMNTDMLRSLLFAYPDAIAGVLDHLDHKYGGAEKYAVQMCGLTPADIAKLKHRFLQ